MLDKVLDYARNSGITSEPGFAAKSTRWAITCNRDGQYTGVLPLAEGKHARQFDFCPNLAQSEMIAGGITRSQFLIDSLQNVVLYLKESATEKECAKARAKHDFFVELLEQAGEEVPPLTVIASLLRDEEKLQRIRDELAQLTPKPKPTDNVTFRVDGDLVLDLDDWHGWWRAFRNGLLADMLKSSNKKTTQMRCLLSGDMVEPAKTHKAKIKKLPGGLTTGDALIGFDKEAFQSYGLDKSENAATSEETATLYAETLNHLIQESSTRFGDISVAHWFSKSIHGEEDAFSFFQNPDTPEPGTDSLPRKLLKSIQSGKREDLANNHYFALTLSGASGRVMVRDWMEGQFPELVESIDRWFSDLAIVSRDGKGLALLPKFLAVAGSTERDLDDVPPPLMAQLFKTASCGQPFPQAAQTKALLRNRVQIIKDEPINHAGIGLIKAFHVRNKGDQHMGTHLNPEHPEVAYQCGRLLAILARLQRRALGDVGAGVVQRYYSAASQTPALTIGRLMSNAKNHLSKLDGGLQYWYENQLADVMAQIDNSIPKTLDLEKQSLFALGYYQQIAQLNAGKDKSNDNQGED